jgi:outer membrane protein assembly factor BamE
MEMQMKKLSVLLAASTIALAVTGCATPFDHKTGTYVAPETIAAFAKGKTTREDVVAALGQPPEKKEVMGKEVWTYPYMNLPANPYAKKTQETTVVEFDRNGKLISAYKAGAVPGKTGNAMLDAAGM